MRVARRGAGIRIAARCHAYSWRCGVRDLGGHPLATDVAWSFTIGTATTSQSGCAGAPGLVYQQNWSRGTAPLGMKANGTLPPNPPIPCIPTWRPVKPGDFGPIADPTGAPSWWDASTGCLSVQYQWTSTAWSQLYYMPLLVSGTLELRRWPAGNQCPYDLPRQDVIHGPTASIGTVYVYPSTEGGCDWHIWHKPSWLTFESPTSGNSAATLDYRLDDLGSGSRTDSIVLQGTAGTHTITVTQHAGDGGFAGGTMPSGGRLYPGRALYSPLEDYQLFFQHEGNLVLCGPDGRYGPAIPPATPLGSAGGPATRKCRPTGTSWRAPVGKRQSSTPTPRAIPARGWCSTTTAAS